MPTWAPIFLSLLVPGGPPPPPPPRAINVSQEVARGPTVTAEILRVATVSGQAVD